ncbi:MAG: ATP-binding protein [Methanomassiliicoccales archaeon]|nr:ATP-binding protein [Methanomassiliicoccales archaeon]
MPIEYTNEDLIARWEEFFETTEYRLKVKEVSDMYPELRSVLVSYSDIDQFDPDIADYLLQHPHKTLWTGEQAIRKMIPPGREGVDIHLRIVSLPRDSRIEIRKLRSKHLGKLISVEGLVRKATEVRPKITSALFQCMRCNQVIREPQEGLYFKEPLECYKEQGGCGRTASTTKFKLLTEESHYVDTQKIEIQESPEGLRGGAQPERLIGYLEDDIAGKISPGDRVILNGVLRSVQKGAQIKSTLFDINLDINSVEFQQHEYEEITISEEDEQEIIRQARSPDIFEKIVKSISPAIYGYEIEKEAIALQLFGGVPKQLEDGTRIRGDIHILLVGDPGVAKCVTYETEITLGDGTKRKIGEIVEEVLARKNSVEVDDGVYAETDFTVLTFSHRGIVEEGKAVRVWKRRSPDHLLRVTTAGGRTLIATSTHPLFVQNGPWVQPRSISKLEIGRYIAVAEGPGRAGPDETIGYARGLSWDRIVSIEKIRAEDEWVYDIEVEETHNFIANGIISHNSQLLRYMSELAPRGIYASGKGSSAAGLTAAAVKDEFGEGRWTLEAGALVLADKGIAAIDELDKMEEHDRSAMHEAMESQTVTVAKAGITARLQCRCAILGAANPKYGRFEEHNYIADQINLPPALLSRFDLIFAMTDKPDAELDAKIADHILKAHRWGQLRKYKDPSEIKEIKVDQIIADSQELTPVFSRDFFRKYIAYSKRFVPVLTDEAMKIIHDYYLQIRKQGEGEGASVPITARQLEAFIRLSEASARARLSPLVTAEDANRAVRIVEYYLRKIAGEAGRLDIDIITTGTSKSQREQIGVLRKLISDLSDPRKGVSVETLVQAADREGISEDKVRLLLKRLSTAGEIYSPSPGYYKLASEE